MAKRFYSPKSGGTELDLFIDPQEFTQAADQARLAVVQEFRAMSDEARTELAICRGAGSLVDFDKALEDEEFDLLDRLDYYSYENRVENLTVRDGAWFSPEAVEAFCGEEIGFEATKAIDGSFSEQWRHDATERHSITVRLRGYPKKITRLRFRYGSGEPDREQLTNLDVRAARALGMIDDPSNLIAQGLNPTWTGIWIEVVLPSPKANARYVKLEFDTSRGDNFCQMRELEVRVETRDP